MIQVVAKAMLALEIKAQTNDQRNKIKLLVFFPLVMLTVNAYANLVNL